jgi:hypothetical protein
MYGMMVVPALDAQTDRWPSSAHPVETGDEAVANTEPTQHGILDGYTDCSVVG